MKHTKIAGFVFGLLFLLMVSTRDSKALVPIKRVDDLLLKPTATPTSKIILQKQIDPNLKKIVTSIPTSVPPTVTMTSTPSVTPTIAEPTQEPTGEVLSEQIEPINEPTPTKTVTPTTTTTPTETQSNSLTMWFLIITIGLLALIIVIQAWPRKEKIEE